MFGFICEMMMKDIAKMPTKSYIALLLCLGAILIYPLISDKIIPGHDYAFHVSRILDVAESLKTGIFPVRIYVDDIQFWGTPVGIFYPGLFLYFPALLKLAGIPTEICYNLFIAMILYIGIISSWYGFSILARSKITGFFSSILYVSSGYYMIDTYIRNALGELLGLSFLPLAIACIIDFITKKRISHKCFILGIFSISAIIESHVLMSAFLVIFSLFLIISNYKLISLKIVKRLFIVVSLIFFLNATFIIPFLFYYVNVPLEIDYINYFSQSGFDFKHLLLFFVFFNFWLFVALYFYLKTIIFGYNYENTFLYNKKSLTKKLFINYNAFFCLGLLFTLLSSQLIPWDTLYPLKMIFETMQFSWRFLGIATLFLSICGGVGLRLLLYGMRLKTRTIVLLSAIMCMTNLITMAFFNPLPFNKIEQKVNWCGVISNSISDYLYKGMNVQELFKLDNQYITNVEIHNWHKKLTDVSFTYSAKVDSTITIPLVNYPGYIATDQKGNEIQIKENSNHVMVVLLPKGEGNVEIHYNGLLLFKISDIISLMTLVFIVFYMIQIQRQKKWNLFMQLAE